MKLVDLSEAAVSTCWECGAQSGPGVQFCVENDGPVLCAECLRTAQLLIP